MKIKKMRILKILATYDAFYEEILDILEQNGLNYAISDRSNGSGTPAMISCPLPAHSVEPVRSEIDELELGSDIYIVVMDPETVVPAERGDQNRYSQVEELGYRGISRSELHSKAADLIPEFTIYTLMAAISAIIATANSSQSRLSWYVLCCWSLPLHFSRVDCTCSIRSMLLLVLLLTGKMYDRQLAVTHFWLTTSGIVGIFSILLILGMQGLLRRMATYPLQYAPIQQIATVATYVTGFG